MKYIMYFKNINSYIFIQLKNHADVDIILPFLDKIYFRYKKEIEIFFVKLQVAGSASDPLCYSGYNFPFIRKVFSLFFLIVSLIVFLICQYIMRNLITGTKFIEIEKNFKVGQNSN